MKVVGMSYESRYNLLPLYPDADYRRIAGKIY